jgi:hypothetical protein
MFERFNALYLLQYTYYHPPISRTLFFFSISFLFLFYFLHLILRTSAVQFHLRYDLTADVGTSCARDLHFFTLFFPYFYFIFLMFERFYALCLLQYTTRYTSNLSNIPCQSFVFTRAYCSQSRLLPRYNFTFGMILPRIYATPLHSFSTSHSFTFLS